MVEERLQRSQIVREALLGICDGRRNGRFFSACSASWRCGCGYRGISVKKIPTGGTKRAISLVVHELFIYTAREKQGRLSKSPWKPDRASAAAAAADDDGKKNKRKLQS